MSKLSRTGVILMAAAIVAGGCANTEELSGRRPEEYKNYGGTPYASDAVNEANLFGTEGSGLSSNPATKPSKTLLGDYDASVGPVTIKVVPEVATTKTNEIVEVNVELKALSSEDGKTEVSVPKPMQLVIVLESGDADANGALVWSSKDSAGATLNENGEYSNKLVITTSNDGKAKFRVQTGTLYNMENPMYWVNVWSANADAPGSMALNVQRPPRIGDPGLSEGSLDVVNNLDLDPTADAGILEELSKAKTKFGSADMTAKLKTHQELFVKTEKTFAVHLVGAAEAGVTDTSAMKPQADETICWKVVTDDSEGAKNDGGVFSPAASCSTTDENGDVFVGFNTGSVYNTKYYLNFYHQVASPVSFEIVTFVMPETLGTDGAKMDVTDFLGEDGKLPDGMKVDLPSEDELITSPAGYPMMTTEDSRTVLEKIAENDEKMQEVLDEYCYDPKIDDELSEEYKQNARKDADFVCNLVQDDSGSWTVWRQASCTDDTGKERFVDSITECEEGEVAQVSKPVTADLDGDGVKENVSIVIEEVYTGKDGKPVILVDDDGQAYYIDDSGNRVDVDIQEKYKDDDGSTIYVNDDGTITDDKGNVIGKLEKAFVDSEGNIIYKDKDGKYFYFDDKGNKVYVDLSKPYKDVNGHTIYKGKDAKGNDVYFYYDEDGNRVEISKDNWKGSYYIDKDGNIVGVHTSGDDGYYYYDKDNDKIVNVGEPAFKDNNGNYIFKDKHGGYYYIDKDGNPVKVDVKKDSDGKYYYEDSDGKHTLTPTGDMEYYIDKDGKIHNVTPGDGYSAVDDKGNRTDVDHGGAFTGYDTTGDGTPNTSPDPCALDSSTPGCDVNSKDSDAKRFYCSKNGGKSFQYGCGVQSYGIQESVDIKTQIVNNSNDNGENGRSISYKLLRSADERNNGAFSGEESETEATKTSAKFVHKEGATNDGVSGVLFDTGTAHSTQYYVQVIDEDGKARPVSYPYYVKYSVKIPTGEGDSPSAEDVEKAINEPPGDMPEKDTSVGDVLIVADGATSFNTVIAKTLILKARIVNAETKRAYSNTNVYWKVVRGASESNNGVLKNTKTATDSSGYAMNEFFTGTGYDSTYYAIAYHPNCKEENGCEPLVFTIHTENFSGNVDGPTGDPSSPCDPEVDEHQCKAVYPCKDDPSKECEEGDPNANTDDGPTKVDGVDIIKKYPAGPDAVCTVADLASIKQCIGGDNTKCNLAGKEKGCLLFELLSNEDGAEKETPTTSPGEEARSAYTNKAENINARLSWFDGSDWQIVDSRFYWTLDKSADADGSLMYMKTFPADSGVVSNTLKTGSAETKYRVNVAFPNIYECESDGLNCKMKPLSTVVSVSPSTFVEGEDYPANKLNLTFNKEIKAASDVAVDSAKIKNVEIYVVSSETNSCNINFVLQSKSKREAQYGTMMKGRNEKIYDGANTWDVLSASTKTYEMADQRESLLVYTVATDGSGNPIAYNCTENLSFPIKKRLPTKCGNYTALCTGEAAAANADLCATCTNEINKEITLTEVPMSIEGMYYTKTLFDIGGMLANKENIVHKKLLDLATKYKTFMNPEDADKTVGEQIVGKLFSYLVFENVEGESASQCFTNFCKGKWDYNSVGGGCLQQYKDKNSSLDNSTLNCNTVGENSTTNKCDAKWLHFKECGCICGKTYYYTQKNSLGSMLTPLIKKGLAKLVDSALGTDDMSMDEVMCNVFDSIQFIEFTGTVSLKESSSANVGYEGAFEYSGLNMPAIGELDSEMSVIRGKWESASYKENKITFKNMPVMLSYGKLAYQILGKYIVGMDESGKADLLGFVNCESIFKSDLSLPIIGSFDASGLQAICSAYKENLSGQIFEFADGKEATTNITFDTGTGHADGKSSNCKDGKCQANTLINGSWEGTGTYKGKDDAGQATTKKYDATALWFAALEKSALDNLSYNTGDEEKDLDAWKKEKSVCSAILDEGAARAKVLKQIQSNPTNKACLGGTFSGDSKERQENNYCSEVNCQNNPSIVVCTQGEEGWTLNDKYANSKEDVIINDAKASCYKAAKLEGTQAEKDAAAKLCDKNAEVEGWNATATNTSCYADGSDKAMCALGGCGLDESISVVVCNKDQNNHDFKNPCPAGEFACFRKFASKACSEAECSGDCKNNIAEAVVCGEREEHTLAVWTNFDGSGAILNGDGHDNGDLDKYVKQGILPDADSCDANELVCGAFEGTPLKFMVDVADNVRIKVVSGSDNDGALGAVGISKLGEGKITITLPKRANIWGAEADVSDVNTECTDYQISMKILGDGRRLKAYWNNMEMGNFGSGITTNGTYKLFKPADVKSKFYADGDNLFTIVMDPAKPDESNKMLRIDEIKITAKCYPYSDNTADASGSSGSGSNIDPVPGSGD
ncbi:MAG: hypothetical protein IIY06_07740 [Proteobacteria bacterium]|nr:hypothetical protein [Pseudomonadota bacterium]